ncbi:hypothetical protein QZH56_27890 [Streptomyces olivoreticuli]|uniref:hypothetical protein n=1 Tax=Streptomyces olivoreticuli TaxID=68246 RepID=UPI0026587796|nr:hypothetical protein [Streptomyces olivoreticuli]WKK22567.1 hypothetical protein QZH56_27890 [Streptomyces olivoreticuli]
MPDVLSRRGGCLGAFLRSARSKADSIFTASGPGRVMDPTIDSVQKWRAIGGAVASFLLIWTYGIDGGWSGVFKDGVGKLFMAPLILILVGPLVILGFIWYAPAERRPLLRSRLRHPLKAVGWYVGAVAGSVACLYAGAQGSSLGSVLGGTVGMMVGGALPLVLLPVLLWMVAFLFFSSGAAARYAFNTADVHAALPAVLTVVLVWVLNFVSLGDGLPNGPVLVKIAAFLGGPLSVTAVSCWELHYLRTRHGVRIRG